MEDVKRDEQRRVDGGLHVCVRGCECLSGGSPETRDIRLLLLQILEIASRRRVRMRGPGRLCRGIFNIVPGDCPD